MGNFNEDNNKKKKLAYITFYYEILSQLSDLCLILYLYSG